MNILKKIRLKWFIARRSMGFTSDYLERIYKIYLNHTKVIHFRDGFPVYSLSTPALYSKPMVNFLARQLFRGIQNKNIPNLMSFAINDDCNAACKHCSFYEGVDDKDRDVITTEQAKKIIADAQALGVSVINIVGGEPTLRSDLPELIRSADKSLSTVVMFTNGSVLSEKAKELRDAGLDGVYISIDSSDPMKHDKLRRHGGLFEKAMKGIQEAKRVGFTVGISACITPESYKDGELDKIVELGKKAGVHEIIIFDAMPTGRFKFRDDLVDNNDWIEDLIASTEKYNKDESYPGVLVYAYATSHKSVGCSGGASYFYISPYGDMMPCDFNHAKFGNVVEQPLYKVWDNLTSNPEFKIAKWGGCKIKDSAYRAKDTVSTGKGCAGC